ncbi:MAG: Nif3-like dinuclear metal center hexameric protein [Moraxellaceae bacterium]|nr:MAG: Nif3-like dinuclear metal center hexameric protein [Moraxellaceae bacterium]
MVSPKELERELNRLLVPENFRDYAPNGMQIASDQLISRLVTGVSATQALIEAAITQKAQAILVHHGYFWKGENPCLVGMKYRRIKQLMEHDISLFAYHLPIDAHPTLGNNAQLAGRLGIHIVDGLDKGNPYSIGNIGEFSEELTGQQLSQRIADVLGRVPLHIDAPQKPIRTVAWCTGGAQGYIEQAIACGVDAYITGEASEQTTHIARENGIHFFAAGHHATERYGVAAVGAMIAEKYDIKHEFIDIDNPV